MRELRSAVTQRLKEQGQRKSALQLWAKLSAVFNKGGAEGVAEVLEELAKRPVLDKDVQP